MPRHIAFALPGDITTLTGGYIYDNRLVAGLRDLGRTVDVIALPDSFPTPSPADMTTALAQLQALPPDRPVIVDGLAFGALDPVQVAGIAAPIVALVHHPLAQESGLPADLARHLWQTERANLSHARHVLVPSPHTRDMLIQHYDVTAKRITVARPGTDRPKAMAAQPMDPALILSVGILHPRKGHDVLIAALSLLADLDWQAVIVGSPRDAMHAADLRAQILASGISASGMSASGMSGRVQLAGQVDADRLAQLYRQASIFALATRYEGYGIVFDEALSHGLPIVSTRAGAVPDTVPQDAGLLVAPDDAPALAHALRQVLSDPIDRRTRATAAARAGSLLPGWSDTARLVAAVLDGLVS